MKSTLYCLLQLSFILYCFCSKKPVKFNQTDPAAKFDNPNYIRDRFKNVIFKPEMPIPWKNRFRKPFHSAWMDYCDPYHCNDYHKLACGLNRKNMKFKWFQSACHIILNNQCATYRGSLKYDVVDPKFCMIYVMYLRTGCPVTCTKNMLQPVCGVSKIDGRSTLFINKCIMENENCESDVPAIHITNPKQTEVTLNIHERVRLLKEEFVNEMQIARLGPVNPVADDFPDYVYEDNDVQPITPISNDDERKKKHRFMLRQFKTTRNAAPQFKVQTEPKLHKKARNMKEKRHRKNKLTSKPVDIFYRRQYDFSFMESQACWIHCQDLITPFLTGQKKNLTKSKRVVVKDPIVIRLVQLINLNTTGSSKDDIYSILYQISNLQIRLFQWDVSSIMFLYKGLLKNQQPSFRTLKQALKERFKSWSLDITNTSNLLKQARIFRPPCVQITGFDGSTKNPRSTFYTRPTTKKCAEDDDDEDCRHQGK